MQATNHQAMIDNAKAHQEGSWAWANKEITRLIENDEDLLAGGLSCLIANIAVATAMADSLVNGIPDFVQGETREFIEAAIEYTYSEALERIMNEDAADRNRLFSLGFTDFGPL